MPALRLRLLGHPSAEFATRTVAFAPEHRFQLIAFLAARGDWVGRDEIAHLFWPEHDNSGARANLRWLLHSIRGMRGFALEAKREQVRFAPATDLHDFEVALAEGRHDDALDLCRGPFLDGLDGNASEPFAHWLRSLRRHVAERLRTAVMAEIARAADDERVLQLARRILEHDACDEEATQALLAALVRKGRAADAQREYRRFAQLLLDELGLEPSASTRALVHDLQARTATRPASAADPPAPAPPRPAPQPAPAPFVGRRTELAQLEALLQQPDCRLLTIIGPGGIGKSRIAAELAASRGASVVPLETLRVPSEVAPHVARVLGLGQQDVDDPETKVAEHLRTGVPLVLLDNFEHLIDGAELLSRWLAAAPATRIVVTSRERLDVPGEWIFRLEGLLGDASAPAQQTDAWKLFVERASRLNFDFDAGREHAGMREIVELVEGMPLAIELAAAWTRLLPCADIAADLRRGLDVLCARGEASRADHASIRATFEHSWRLLMPREQALLMRLSVFRGGFTRAAAEDVAEASLSALASLVDKSLVRAGAGGRLSLHPLLRTYAAEKLTANPDAERGLHERHAGFYLGLLARQAAASSSATQDTLAEADADIDNCLAAWQFVVDTRDFALLESAAIAWAMYFELRGRMRQAHDFFAALEAALGASAWPPRMRAHAAWCRATFHMRLGALAEAQARAHEALATYKAVRDAVGILRCVNTLGMASWQRGEYARAAHYFGDGLRRATALRDAAAEWRFAMNLALAKQSSGDLPAARALFERAEANARRRDDRRGLALTLNNLGNLCIGLDQPDEARRHLLESVTLAEESGTRLGQPFTLVNLALLDIARREWASARRHVDRALAFVRGGADRQVEPMCLYTLARIEGECGEMERAREHLASAAGISLESRNVPNMVEVAMVAAHLDVQRGAPERAAAALALVRAHPGTSDKERREAAERLEALGTDVGAAAMEMGHTLTLEALMARLVSEGERVEATQPVDVPPGDWCEH